MLGTFLKVFWGKVGLTSHIHDLKENKNTAYTYLSLRGCSWVSDTSIEKVCADPKWLPPERKSPENLQPYKKGKSIQNKFLKMLHILNKISSKQSLKFTVLEIKNHWYASEWRYTALIFHGIMLLQTPWKSSPCFGIKKLSRPCVYFR